MPSLPRPDNRLYLGRGGSGKSTLARRHADEFDRVLLVLPDESEPIPRGWTVTRDRADLVKRVLAPTWRIAFPTFLDIEQWEWANEAAWHAGGCAVIWEEAGRYTIGGSLKGSAPHAFNLWMAGRHRRVHLFACSQRPASLRADFRANLFRACIFHSTEEDDLRWYRAMGSRELVERIKTLDYGAHEAVDWSPAGWQVRRAPFP